MKKLIIILLATLLLTGCAIFDEPTPDVEKEPDSGIVDDEKGEQKPDDGEQKPDDGEQKPDDGEQKPDDTEQGDKDDIRQISISDYIISLGDSLYANDKDFLSFAASLDQRSVGKVIYASPDGSEDGEGTIDSPLSIYEAIDAARAGDTVYLRGGEYIFTEAIWLSRSGKAGSYITVKSYPGESARLTTTPENVAKYDEDGEYLFFGFDAGVGYWIFEDLEIYGATDEYVAAFACYDGGQNHLIFKNNRIHDLKTTYLEGGANAFLFLGEKKNSINNILVIGNECYDLVLGYSEAVSFAGNCEYCYVIDNTVRDVTNIGIDFYGNAGYCGTASLDQARYSVAAYNTVYNCNSPYADCAGIYVDGGKFCLIEGNLIYNCQYGIEIGSEEKQDSYPVTDIVVVNNICKENSVCALRIGGYDTKTSGVVKSCTVANNSFIGTKGEFDVIISMVDGIVFANNLFASDASAVETEFSTSYIKNISFISNLFDTEEELELFGKEMTADRLNGEYGSGNIVADVLLDGYAQTNGAQGSAEYMPKYDFYRYERDDCLIGAVE